MGIIESGILKGHKGCIGPYVTLQVGGVDIIRTRPKKSLTPPSARQALMRHKFSTAVQFLNGYKEFAKKYYGVTKGLQSPYNLALSHLLNIIEGDIETFQLKLNYSQLKFSQGIGQSPSNVHLDIINQFECRITWENQIKTSEVANDQLIVLIAKESQKIQPPVLWHTPAQRKDEVFTLHLLPYDLLHRMHCWIAFLDAQKRWASPSAYVGSAHW